MLVRAIEIGQVMSVSEAADNEWSQYVYGCPWALQLQSFQEIYLAKRECDSHGYTQEKDQKTHDAPLDTIIENSSHVSLR